MGKPVSLTEDRAVCDALLRALGPPPGPVVMEAPGHYGDNLFAKLTLIANSRSRAQRRRIPGFGPTLNRANVRRAMPRATVTRSYRSPVVPVRHGPYLKNERWVAY